MYKNSVGVAAVACSGDCRFLQVDLTHKGAKQKSGDKVKDTSERMKEFVKYHMTGDGECNGILLKAYADKHDMSLQERYDLAYFYSVTYCIPSAVIMLKSRAEILQNPEQWAERNKERLIFQSDRRYAKLNNRFQKILVDYAANIKDAEAYIDATVKGNTIIIKKALNISMSWYYFERFCAFLFIETLCLLMGYSAVNMPIQWKDGDTATSGLMNLFGFDKSADYFDKHDRLPSNNRLIQAIRKAGGETNVTEVETSLCAYRKFYKGSRYNGYYLDRQLEELRYYEQQPGTGIIVKELYQLRKKLFPHKYLGELHNWNGVRRECKTLYKRTGQMM